VLEPAAGDERGILQRYDDEAAALGVSRRTLQRQTEPCSSSAGLIHSWLLQQLRHVSELHIGVSQNERVLTSEEMHALAQLRRARDLMDREYAKPLDVPTLARHALMSPAHFARRFKAAYGETPYGYLMTRRIERAMALLRAGSSATDACMAVGSTSLGSFSVSFRAMTGETPGAYRSREHSALEAMPSCMVRVLSRPTPRAALSKQPAPARAGG